MSLDATTIVTQLPLAAGALVLVWLLITGRLHTDGEFQRVSAERDSYKDALADERVAADEAAQAASTTNRLLDALVQLAGRDKAVP